MLGVSPVLIVYPLMKAMDFYREKLGFICLRLGDPPTFAVLERDHFTLYLDEADFEVAISPSGGRDLHLRVEDLCAELAVLRKLDVPIEFGPVELVDGPRKRSFVEILDPNGYRVCIEQQTRLTGGGSSRQVLRAGDR